MLVAVVHPELLSRINSLAPLRLGAVEHLREVVFGYLFQNLASAGLGEIKLRHYVSFSRFSS